MPKYQFACQGCGQGFERKLRMSQASETQTCPECGGTETRKVLGTIAIGGASRGGHIPLSAPPVSSPFS